MEVMASIPDELINEVQNYTGRANVSESLIAVLEEWLSFQKIKEINKKIETQPFEFLPDFTSDTIRSINRKQ
jgi:hypothetical protein